MSHANFNILYDGPALADHRMEVRDLAPALLALAATMEEANMLLNGDKAKLAVSVKGSFKTGSFGVDLNVVQTLLSQVTDLFNDTPVTGALNMLTLLGFVATGGAGVLGLIKWVRGRKIRRVELLENGSARFYIDDEHYDVEQSVLKLYRYHKLRKALEDAVAKPLERDGIETFAVRVGEGAFVEVCKAEGAWFIAPEWEVTPLEEVEFECNVQLVNISFRDENKWRFSDGISTFHAAIVDADFLRSVQQNQAVFSKNDLLKVRMGKRQWLQGDDMKTEYTVLKVLEHRHAASQLRLPLDEPR
jgi:hypothetical protein